MRATVKSAVAAVLLALVAAAPATAASHDGSFVGTVHGTRAFVAVVVHGTHVQAYACDSKKIAQWFSGRAENGRATLRSKRGDVLRITLGSRHVRGSLRLHGGTAAHRFVAARDTKPAGLYRGKKGSYLGGWIILPDGRQRGEVVSGTTDIASPTLDPNNPTVEIKRKKLPPIVIIVILIGL